MPVKLGEKVKDSVSGFEGKVTQRTERLFAPALVFVEPLFLKDGRTIAGVWFDEQRLETEGQGKSDAPLGFR